MRQQNVQGTIYLLHLNGNLKNARHYVGWTSNLEKRMKTHRKGNSKSSAFMRAVKQCGITFEIARLWSGTRNDERKIKNRKNGPALCPICNNYVPELTYLQELDVPEHLQDSRQLS